MASMGRKAKRQEAMSVSNPASQGPIKVASAQTTANMPKAGVTSTGSRKSLDQDIAERQHHALAQALHRAGEQEDLHIGGGEAQEIGGDDDGRGGEQDVARAVAPLQEAGAGAAGDGEGEESGGAPAQQMRAAELEHDAGHDGGDQEPAEGLDRDAQRNRPDDARAAAEEQGRPARRLPVRKLRLIVHGSGISPINKESKSFPN